MLRKKHALKGKNVIGGRDQKALRDRCLRLYGVSSVAGELFRCSSGGSNNCGTSDDERAAAMEELLASAFFPKNAQCVQHKWQYAGGNTHVLVYLVNTVPLCMECVSLASLEDNNAALLSPVSPSFLAPTLFGALRLRHVIGEHRTALEAAALATGCVVGHLRGDGGAAMPPPCPADPGCYLGPLLLTRNALVVWVNEATPTYVFRGAHLMGAGVQYLSWTTGAAAATGANGDCDGGGGSTASSCPLDWRIEAGGLAYVCVRDNPTPFAVGVVTKNLADTFNNPAYAHTLPSPRYPTTTAVRFLKRGAGGEAKLDGPGVFVLSSVGDQLWEAHLHDYQVHCTAKMKLARDSLWILPDSFRAATTTSGGGGGDSTIPALPGVDLFGFRASSAASDGGDGSDAAQEMEGRPPPDCNDGDDVAPHAGPPPSAAAEAAAISVEEEEAEQQSDDGDATDWWRLFPTPESMLMFALCEAVRGTAPSKLPVPITSFVNTVAQCLPRGLPALIPEPAPSAMRQERSDVEVHTGTAPDDDGSTALRLALASSHTIDWKKTAFKKALSMMTATPEIRDMVGVREAKRGVHEVNKVSKSCAMLSQHKRTYREFLVCVHQPAVEEALEQSAMEEALRQLGGGGGDTPLALRVQSELRIESIDYMYRPQGGLNPQLLRMLTKGKWTPPKPIEWPELGAGPNPPLEAERSASDGSGSDDDDDDDAMMPGLVPLKSLRDHLRAYARDQGLMVAAAGTAGGGGPPEIRIDATLRHLWPTTAKEVPGTMPLLALDRLVEQRFCPMYVLRYATNRMASASMGRSKLKNGRPPLVHLYTEKRSGNKIVTIVRGLDAYGFSLEALALAWKSKFATSVSVVDPVKRDNLTLKSGTKVPREIQLQGAQPVEAHLVSAMGLPKSLLANRK